MSIFLLVFCSVSFLLNLLLIAGYFATSDELEKERGFNFKLKQEQESVESAYAKIAALKRKLRSQRVARKFQRGELQSV